MSQGLTKEACLSLAAQGVESTKVWLERAKSIARHDEPEITALVSDAVCLSEMIRNLKKVA